MSGPIPKYLRTYAEGQTSASRAEAQADALLMAHSPTLVDTRRTSALSALAKFRMAARGCPDPEAKALILAQAAKWANATQQPKVADKLLSQAIAISTDEQTIAQCKHFKAVMERSHNPRLVLLPHEVRHG